MTRQIFTILTLSTLILLPVTTNADPQITVSSGNRQGFHVTIGSQNPVQGPSNSRPSPGHSLNNRPQRPGHGSSGSKPSVPGKNPSTNKPYFTISSGSQNPVQGPYNSKPSPGHSLNNRPQRPDHGSSGNKPSFTISSGNAPSWKPLSPNTPSWNNHETSEPYQKTTTLSQKYLENQARRQALRSSRLPGVTWNDILNKWGGYENPNFTYGEIHQNLGRNPNKNLKYTGHSRRGRYGMTGGWGFDNNWAQIDITTSGTDYRLQLNYNYLDKKGWPGAINDLTAGVYGALWLWVSDRENRPNDAVLQKMFKYVSSRIAVFLSNNRHLPLAQKNAIAIAVIREYLMNNLDSISVEGNDYYVKFRLASGGKSPWVRMPTLFIEPIKVENTPVPFIGTPDLLSNSQYTPIYEVEEASYIKKSAKPDSRFFSQAAKSWN